MAQVADITRLTGKENYLLWMIGVEALLCIHRLWNRVDYDYKALGFIVLTIDPKLAFKIIEERKLNTIDTREPLKQLAEMFTERGWESSMSV